MRVQPSRHDSDNLPSKTLIVSFTEPTKRFWTLFGVSLPAKLINKPQAPRQCDICWDFHPPRGCRRLPVCENCGKPGHKSEDCDGFKQCANCLAPHGAKELAKCLARPRLVHGVLRPPTKEQKKTIRKMGLEIFYQEHPELRNSTRQTQSNDAEIRPPNGQEPTEQPVRTRSPTVNTVGTAPSCIMVATTPELAVASPLKRRRHHGPVPSI